MVKQITVYKFVTENGYELVEKFGKSQTSSLLKISRPTIDAILEKHPTAPEKTLPKYVFQWEETKGNKLFTEKYQNRLRSFPWYLWQGMRMWLFLGKKDPASWVAEDFRNIWESEKFRDHTTSKMNFNYAVACRKWMRAIGKTDLCSLEEFETKGLKRPKGIKKQWFLEDEEITALIDAMDREDVLVAFVLSLCSGGRASSVMPSKSAKGLRPMDVDERNSGILMFEPKRQEYILRLFHPKIIELTVRYVHDHGIAPTTPLFLAYDAMRRYLKQAASKGRVSKVSQMQGAWHITKHTFVSQGAYHGLSLEVISEQTGTDANTLVEYYAGVKEKKMRAELLGENVAIEPFHEWALRVIVNPALRKYNKLTKDITN